jgi:hypothetical protein
MEKTVAIAELEAQEVGLLPDRVEMRRRRHRRGGRRRVTNVSAEANNFNENVNVIINQSDFEFDD